MVGEKEEMTIRITNLFQVDDNQITITGTGKNDYLAIDLGELPSVTINGVGYALANLHVDEIHLDGGAGVDTLQLVGNRADEQALVSTESVELKSAKFRVVATDVEDVALHSGGGQDVIDLIGSLTEDLLVATATEASLKSNSHVVTARGFMRVTANGNGGSDVAYLHGTQSDDVFMPTSIVAHWRAMVLQ